MAASRSTPIRRLDETAPLLRADSSDSSLSATAHPSTDPNSRRATRVVVLVCFVIVAVDFGYVLSIAPQTEIFESIICARLHPGDQKNCKTPDVQGELALLIGWQETFNQLPGVIFAVPYGLIADSYGRKPVLLLSLIGLILEEASIRLICWWNVIPLHAIWVMPLLQVIGGGPGIATSMAYTIVSDVFLMEKRSSIFFVMAAAILVGEVLATPLSAALMSWTPWFPAILSVLIELLGFLASLAIPETNPKRLEDDGQIHMPTNGRSEREETWLSRLAKSMRQIRLNTNTICVVIAFLVASIGRQAVTLIIQYASSRFNWSIARASFLITLKGIINMVLLLAVLPQLSLILNRFMPPVSKDLHITVGSSLFLGFGSLLMALAAHPPLFIAGICFLALGWGFYSTLRSLGTALVPSSHVGVLNTTIAVSQSIGTMAAGPILAATFRQGMGLDGVWQGLPYMVATCLFVVVGLLICFIRVPSTEVQEVET